MNFNNRVAIVTGGANGIGKAAAIQFAHYGATVIIADLDEKGANKVKEQIEEQYDQECMAEQLDVNRKDDIDNMISRVVQRFGKIDILAHCAGICYFGIDFLDLSEETWNQVINVNLKGTFLIGQRVMKEMVKNHYGRIINTGSIAGEIGGVLSGADYAASKGGVFALTKTMAKIGAPYHITANCISPGHIDTQMTSVWNDKEKKSFTDRIPLKRFGKAEEAAWAILLLASEESSFITGVVLDVNGGILMA
jgi:3-oxoacyl-[acyl-carrier protein] reductase